MNLTVCQLYIDLVFEIEARNPTGFPALGKREPTRREDGNEARESKAPIDDYTDSESEKNDVAKPENLSFRKMDEEGHFGENSKDRLKTGVKEMQNVQDSGPQAFSYDKLGGGKADLKDLMNNEKMDEEKQISSDQSLDELVNEIAEKPQLVVSGKSSMTGGKEGTPSHTSSINKVGLPSSKKEISDDLLLQMLKTKGVKHHIKFV